MEDDVIICNCMEVYKSDIVKAIKEQGLTTVEQVQEATEAGTGCGVCIEEIQEILDELNNE